MIQQAAALGLLAMASAQDIKRKQIEIIPPIVFSIIAIILHIFIGRESIGNLLLGMAIGLIMLILSVVSQGKVGSGDGIILMVTGLFLGAKQNLELLVTGLIFCAIWALILIVVRGKKGNYEIPFIPFLLAAYLVMLIL